MSAPTILLGMVPPATLGVALLKLELYPTPMLGICEEREDDEVVVVGVTVKDEADGTLCLKLTFS